MGHDVYTKPTHTNLHLRVVTHHLEQKQGDVNTLTSRAIHVLKVETELRNNIYMLKEMLRNNVYNETELRRAFS